MENNLINAACNTLLLEGISRKRKLYNIDQILYHLKLKPLPVLLENNEFRTTYQLILITTRKLLYDTETSTRANALRILRHSIWDSDQILLIIDHYIYIYVCQSLERERKSSLWERIQALKLVQRITNINVEALPGAFIRSLIAISSYRDDKLRRMCLETLRHISILNSEVLHQCDGFKVLIDAVLDPSCKDLAEAIMLSIIYVMNNTSTHNAFQYFKSLLVLLSPFTDTDAPAGNDRRQKWNASKNAICLLMKSWTGIYLLTSQPQGIASIIKVLFQPVQKPLLKAILSTISQILYISMPYNLALSSNKKSPFDVLEEYFSRGTFKTSAGKTKYQSCLDSLLTENSNSISQNLFENHRAIILISVIHCGLIEALAFLSTRCDDEEISQMALIILHQTLRLSSRLLPNEHCVKILALPILVDIAAKPFGTDNNLALKFGKQKDNFTFLDHSDVKTSCILACNNLNQLAKAVTIHLNDLCYNRTSSSWANGVHMAAELLNGIHHPITRYRKNTALSQDMQSKDKIAKQIKMTLDSQIDDTTFKDMLYHRSRVLLMKDWSKWDWDIILELLEGPLKNTARLTEAMKTKFFKRLSGFFRCDPGNKGYFAQLEWKPDYVPYIRPACEMYSILLNSPEGLHFLKSDRRGQLLSEISSALEIEYKPEASIVESHIGTLHSRMFSPVFCSRRMIREYFTLLGVMSSSIEGLRLLEQSNVFQKLYLLGKQKGRDFLCRLILVNLDYTIEGSCRNLLQLWIQDSTSQSLRLYAICILRALLRSNTSDFSSWGIDILLTQLYKDDVANIALSVLEEAAQNKLYVRSIALKRPAQLLKLPRAQNLLLKILSTSEGFLFLNDAGWVEASLENWRQMACIKYVHRVESTICRAVFQEGDAGRSSGNSGLLCPIPVVIPKGHNPGERNEGYFSLDWLLRLPWNMEVRLSGPIGSGPPTNLTLDTFVDVSFVRKDEDEHDMEGAFDDFSRNPIKIIGKVVDAKHCPRPVLINSQQTLHACLLLGTQPVDREGNSKPSPLTDGGFLYSHSSHLNGFDKVNNTVISGNSAASQFSRLRSKTNVSDKSRYSSDGGTDAGQNTPVTSTPKVFEAVDVENEKDWTICTPDHRTSKLKVPSCSICVHGERARWCFKVDRDENKSKRAWLESVEFVIQLLPQKQPLFSLPLHFYGELAKTKEGCAVLERSKHIEEFLGILHDESRVPLERRSILWTLGHIASSSKGFELLRKYKNDIIPYLINVTMTSQVISIRSACIFVLGLISKSSASRNYLSYYGWHSPADSMLGISLPEDASSLFKVPSVLDPSTIKNNYTDSLVASDFSLSTEKAFKDIIRLVGDLSNHITRNDAESALIAMKNQYPTAFENYILFLSAFNLLERYNFNLYDRRLIFSLFDKAVPKNIDCITIPTKKNEKSNTDAANEPIDTRRPDIESEIQHQFSHTPSKPTRATFSVPSTIIEFNIENSDIIQIREVSVDFLAKDASISDSTTDILGMQEFVV